MRKAGSVPKETASGGQFGRAQSGVTNMVGAMPVSGPRHGSLIDLQAAASSSPVTTQLQRMQEAADGIASPDITIQRQITFDDSAPQMGWAKAFLAIAYPMYEDQFRVDRAFERGVSGFLKRYDLDNRNFADHEALRVQLKQDIDAWIGESDGGAEVEELSDDGAGPSNPLELVSGAQIFGQPVAAEDRGQYLCLFRSVERGEMEALAATIFQTGKPIFTFKPGKKGLAEKMFAPNKAYVVESMGKKGKRSIMMEILLDRAALDALIYNPEFATSQNDANDWVSADIPKGKSGQHSAITLKRESPKGKKRQRCVSINIGFRQGNDALDLLADYVVSIQLIDAAYDGRDPEDTRKSLA